MKAIIVEQPGGPLRVGDIPVPQPGPGEVLVKIEAAPVNPTDLAGIKRGKKSDFVPFTPGREGAGTVVAAGKGLLPKLWMGKRVSCSSAHGHGGTWAEYMVTGAASCFPLGKKVSTEQGSMSLVNPLTALGFIEIAKNGGHKAIINNAAGSALGRMIDLLCRKNNIKLINIVRSAEKAAHLKEVGLEYVLNSSDPGFPEQLSTMAEELDARLLFDSVCGEGFNTLVDAMPRESTIFIYGNLSPEEHVRINPRTILLKEISVKGFFLGNVTKKQGLLKNMRNLIKVRQLMSTDLKIAIRARFPLDDVQKAIDAYLSDMSAGKVLLIP